MGTVFLIITIITFTIYVYNSILSIACFKKFVIPNTDCENHYNTFSILVPCHNEEEVIYDTMTYLDKLEYDKKYFNVYMILDNCTDNTEKEFNRYITENGRNNFNKIIVSGGSKPKALNNAISILKNENKWNDDNIIILDADNKISPTLLKSYNYYHNRDEKIIQCRILSDNDNNLVSQGFTSSFNLMGLSFQYARNVFGLSASLSGTGFSVDREIFDEVDFTKCDTLTEDLEFSVLCILKGYKIKYVPNEYVLNNHLEEIKPSIVQRIRWCRGHMQTAVKLDKDIIKTFFKRPSIQIIDTFLFVNNPPKSIIYLIANIGSFILSCHMKSNIFTIILILLLIFNFIVVMKANDWKLKYIIPHIVFAVTMKISIFIGTITFKKSKWVKTKHKRNINQ